MLLVQDAAVTRKLQSLCHQDAAPSAPQCRTLCTATQHIYTAVICGIALEHSNPHSNPIDLVEQCVGNGTVLGVHDNVRVLGHYHTRWRDAGRGVHGALITNRAILEHTVADASVETLPRLTAHGRVLFFRDCAEHWWHRSITLFSSHPRSPP